MFRIDLHVHTNYSRDAVSTIPQLVKVAKRKGLSGFAITDHNTINGHPQAKTHSSKDFLIIPGIEISSKEGHILGLMVHEDIPRGLSVEETTERIREQGGIAVAAHPFMPFRTFKKIDRGRFDAIEVFNSHAHFILNPLARKFAQREHFSVTAGSDAHFPDEIGLAGVGVGGSLKPDSVLEEIKRGKATPFGRTISPQRHLKRSLQKTLIFCKKRGVGKNDRGGWHIPTPAHSAREAEPSKLRVFWASFIFTSHIPPWRLPCATAASDLYYQNFDQPNYGELF